MRHTLVFHTIILAKKIQKIIGLKLPPFSLSYSEAATLLTIDSQKNICQTEIATRLHLQPSSVVTLIDEIEKLKLVRRVAPDGNRRKYHIVLTKQGRIKVGQIKKRINNLDNFLKKTLSPKEIQTYRLVLDKLTAYLDHWKGGEK